MAVNNLKAFMTLDFKISVFIVFHVIYSHGIAISQNSEPKILELNTVFKSVTDFHPQAKQALLPLDFAKAELMKAKGAFDPQVGGNLSQKFYEDKTYYSIFNGDIKIPTWIGADFKAGYETNEGVFLNPEINTPTNGLFYGGVSVPLGRGLLIDERRAAVQSAEIGQNLASAARIDQLNELLYNTVTTYFEWFKSYHVLEVFKDAYKNAQERFAAVKVNALNGDRPIIDTVEAKIQIQNIGVGLIQAQNEFKNTATIFSGFFWNERNECIGLDASSIPMALPNQQNILEQNMVNNFATFDQQHPYLEQVRQKLFQLEVDRKLKNDRLKPMVNLFYNPLFEPVANDVFSNLNLGNYKWGLEFKMPLFLRKERGDLKIAKLKIQETDLFLQDKSMALYNKYNTYINEWQATSAQIEVFQNTVKLYEDMLNAEKKLFANGESSLFLVNSREQAWINAKVKLTELIAKNRWSFYSIYYFAGKLIQLVE